MRLFTALEAVLAAAALHGVRAAQDITGKPILALGHDVPVDTPGTYWTPLHACPQPCDSANPEKWTVYNSVQRLSACKEPMVLDFALHNSLKDGDVVKIHACAVGNSTKQQDAIVGSASFIPKRSIASSAKCLDATEENSVSLSINGAGQSNHHADDALLALQTLQTRIQKAQCGDVVQFVYANRTAIGLYSGAAIDKVTITSLVRQMADLIKSQGAVQHMHSEICDGDRNSLQIAGISINTQGDLAAVQQDVALWSKAKCAESRGSIRRIPSFKVQEQRHGMLHHSNRTSFNQTSFNATHTPKKLFVRDDCRVVPIVAGDTCGKLADRCGISPADFTKYNPDDDFCSTLSPYGRACCSPGDLPDIRPKKNADGTCATYLVKSGDDCPTLAGKNGLKTSDIEDFNKGTTWGWNGCEHLLASMNICLSDGLPPMPAPIENAVCGPQKPNSTRPTDGRFIGNINPCPLNACCNIWGQCGISGDFCVEERGPLGNPGTAPPGVNGCVSSCGMGITNDREYPQHGDFGRVGYYETWNMDRDCLRLPVAGANTDSSYTIIHWAFAEVNSDWSVRINDPHSQWDDFKALRGVKRVLSFGGWGYSTDPGTYDVLRQAMSPTNREIFAKNIVNFINKEGLDGVDFDWEYPGALDIPGTPPGKPDDGLNYLKFLMYLRSIVGSIDTMYDVFSISIAAPASYWYLKTFPIDKMARVLDYIVYMTYDLHGQWDAGNKFSDEGCPSGNCLRSHVNLTETTTVLSMITKAGVSTNKIYVGESSYGRSFKMSQSGCTGPDCTFLGDRLNSPAEKGRCTQTSGYISNAEIKEIILSKENVQSFHDGASNSDIVVYDDTEWVAYMSETTKSTRRDLWKGHKFLGTIDWAVDLQSFDYDYNHDDDDGGFWLDTPPTAGPPPDCGGADYKNLDDIPTDAVDYCKNVYILGALKHNLDDAMAHYNNLINGGYEDKFNTYADAVVKSGNNAIEKFMFTESGDYFDCKVMENVQCCAYCHHIHTTPSEQAKYCMYCGDYDCGWDPSCERYQNCHLSPPTFHEISVGCTDWSKRNEDPPQYDYGQYNMATCEWTMRPDKEDDFWKAFSLDTGIDKSNVEFKTVERLPCKPSASEEQCANANHDVNFPVTHDYTRADIPNPEDLVKQIQNGVNSLGNQITDAISRLKAGTFVGSSFDIVDAVSLPVQMVTDAIDQMQTISDKIDEQNAEKRKGIILAFVTAIFLFIPVAGEVASSLIGVATIARIASIAGVVGNAALDIYSIVDDPDNAALAIVSLVFEPLALLDFGKIAKAARIRRGMKAEDVKALSGGKAGAKLEKIDNIRSTCRRKIKRAVLEWDLPMSSAYNVTSRNAW